MSFYEATFTWPQAAKSVIVTGDFDHWKKTIPLTRNGGVFTGTVKVPYNATVHYKFIVDGEWRLRTDLPTARVWASGIVNNVIQTPPEPPRLVTPIVEPEIEATPEVGAPPTSTGTEPVVKTEPPQPPEDSAPDIPVAPGIPSPPAKVEPNVDQVASDSAQANFTLPEAVTDNVVVEATRSLLSDPATVVGIVDTSIDVPAPTDGVVEPAQPIKDLAESAPSKPEVVIEDVIRAAREFVNGGPELSTPVLPTAVLEHPVVQAVEDCIPEPSKVFEPAPPADEVKVNGSPAAEGNVGALDGAPAEIHENIAVSDAAPQPASLDNAYAAPVESQEPTAGEALEAAPEAPATKEVTEVAAPASEEIVSETPVVPSANGNKTSMFGYVANNVGLAIKSFTGIDPINSQKLPDSEPKDDAVETVAAPPDKAEDVVPVATVEFEEKGPEAVVVSEPEETEPAQADPVLVPSDVAAPEAPSGPTEAPLDAAPVTSDTVPTASTDEPAPPEVTPAMTSPVPEEPVPTPMVPAIPSETEAPATAESAVAEVVPENATVAPTTEAAAEKSAAVFPSAEPAKPEVVAVSTPITKEFSGHKAAPSTASATSTPTVSKDGLRKKRLSLFGKIKKEVKGIFHHEKKK